MELVTEPNRHIFAEARKPGAQQWRTFSDSSPAPTVPPSPLLSQHSSSFVFVLVLYIYSYCFLCLPNLSTTSVSLPLFPLNP
ncbi:hypothetical protein NQZ68_002122 [Dissostichus eleginoides]|nr:hypothetical protein NQZ68_002122 [Dissostichus eleginoides]